MRKWQLTGVVAVVAAAAGFGAGMLVSGGSSEPTVQTTTTTVVEEGADEDATTTEELDPESPEGGPVPFTEAFSEQQLTSRSGNGVTPCVAPTGAGTRGLDGEPLEDAAVFNINYENRIFCGPWRIVIPVDEYERLEIGRLGWTGNSPRKVEAELNIRPDTAGSEPLLSESFDGPSDVLADFSLPLDDAQKLIIKWEIGSSLGGELDTTHQFAFDQALLYPPGS